MIPTSPNQKSHPHQSLTAYPLHLAEPTDKTGHLPSLGRILDLPEARGKALAEGVTQPQFPLSEMGLIIELAAHV